jgi:cytochrome c553
MKKHSKLWVSSLVLLSLLTTGCSENEQKDQNEPTPVKPVKVEESQTVKKESTTMEAKPFPEPPVVEEAKKEVAKVTQEVKAFDAKATFTAKCSSCHGINGEKKALNQSAIIAGQEAATLIEKLKGYQTKTYGITAMKGLMEGQVKAFSPQELEALGNYIATLK